MILQKNKIFTIIKFKVACAIQEKFLDYSNI